MPIHAPGKRDRRGKVGAGGGHSAAAPLSLTSMVDMFTILVVFLLMNFSSTGEIIYIPKNVKLPQASETKELKPAHVVSVTEDSIVLERETVAQLADVKAMGKSDWVILPLKVKLAAAFKDDEAKAAKDAKSLKNKLPGKKKKKDDPTSEEHMKKVTVQADKDMDFLTVKRIMATVTEAGADEINFAVQKKEAPHEAPAAN
jgi:biopolymer transport protein ExbD